MLALFSASSMLLAASARPVASKPNIVLMVLDDLGWSDVGYHGSDFPTPNIDKLANDGVRLEKYYVQQVCSPTRSALMSGRYPFHTGLQLCTTIMPGSTAHLPTDQPTLAEALRAVGYATAMIGKWHLGYSSWDYTPVGRGFDSFAGYLQGQVDYFNKTMGLGNGQVGLDFWRNKTVAKEEVGQYSMDFYMREAERVLDIHDASKPLFMYFAHQEIHIPLQSSPEARFAEQCKAVTVTENRNTLCRMTNQLDESIGDFVTMLKTRGMWENTLLWVTTDNGGMAQWQDSFPASASSNFPLRAGKTALFEGGVRGVSFVAGGILPSTAAGRVVSGLLQHVDVATTLAALGSTSLPLADGFDVWDVVANGAPSPRMEVPVNVDDACQLVSDGFSALISGDMKLIVGSAGMYDGWWSNGAYAREEPDESASNVTINGKTVWLFNLTADPNERLNIALAQPQIVDNLQVRLSELADTSKGYLPGQGNTPNPRSFPFLHGGVWAPWETRTSLVV